MTPKNRISHYDAYPLLSQPDFDAPAPTVGSEHKGDDCGEETIQHRDRMIRRLPIFPVLMLEAFAFSLKNFGMPWKRMATRGICAGELTECEFPEPPGDYTRLHGSTCRYMLPVDPRGDGRNYEPSQWSGLVLAYFVVALVGGVVMLVGNWMVTQ